MRVKCEALAQRWLEADDSKTSEFAASDCLDLTSPQVVEFLSILLNHKVGLVIEFYIKLQVFRLVLFLWKFIL